MLADPTVELYPPELRALARGAVARIRRRLRAETPTLAGHTVEWMRALSPTRRPEDYFLHPQAFPMLLLPWWLESAITGRRDRGFQREIVYSSLCGYYFVRLIDDLMDERSDLRAELLPALIFFHTEFQQTYQRLFQADHPFWEAFVGASYAAAETASRDAGLTSIDRADFIATSARKVAGAKIPIAAVGHRHRRAELIEPWAALVDLLGRWHQMLNDVLGWSRDMRRGAATYFLSEAARRTAGERPMTEWIVGDGLAWAAGELESSMAVLRTAAHELESPPLVDYLSERDNRLAVDLRDLAANGEAIRRLAALLR